jgi:hypothetical protein
MGYNISTWITQRESDVALMVIRVHLLLCSPQHFLCEPKLITTVLLTQILEYNFPREHTTIYMTNYIKWHKN